MVLWQITIFIGPINQMSYRYWSLKVLPQTVVLSTMRLNYDRKWDFILYLLTDIWNLCSSKSSQTQILPTLYVASLEFTGNSSSSTGNSKQKTDKFSVTEVWILLYPLTQPHEAKRKKAWLIGISLTRHTRTMSRSRLSWMPLNASGQPVRPLLHWQNQSNNSVVLLLHLRHHFFPS